MSTFLVRNAELSDLPQVFHMERAVLEAPHWTEEEYAAIFGSRYAKRCFLVAQAEGHLIGFAVGRVVVGGTERTAELETVVVALASRRKGVGKTLCEAVIGWSRALDAREVLLEVRAGSAGAIALYEGLSFGMVGRRTGYYRHPDEDALLMRLNLGE